MPFATGHDDDVKGTDADTIERAPAGWFAKVACGAILMCAAAVGAQLSTKSFRGESIIQAIGFGVPLLATVAIFLLTAPPAGHRRSILALLAPAAAVLGLAAFAVPLGRSDVAHWVTHGVILACAPLAGAATYAHLAGIMRAARRTGPAICAAIMALLLPLGAALCLIRYGYLRAVANAWYHTVPGVGERVAPLAFVEVWLWRPAVEWEKLRTDPVWAVYFLLTVLAPLLCVGLMIWLIAWCVRGGKSNA